MLDRFFRLSENHTDVRTELVAGLTTFLTMAYIIFVQPAVLSGQYFGEGVVSGGMDFGAVTTATCLSAALGTLLMGLLARYPIGQAPGMGENFFFVLGVMSAAAAAFQADIAAGQTTAWQVALGVVFVAGVLFFLVSLLGVQERLLGAISPSMRAGIAIGIGLFIAFIGLRGARLVVDNPGTLVALNPQFASPDLVVFLAGLMFTAGLYARRVRGSIVWGILAAMLLAIALKFALPHAPAAVSQSDVVKDSMLVRQFSVGAIEGGVVARPPSLAPAMFKMDLARAFTWAMLPLVLIFLFMDVFDTLGTLVGVAEQAGFMRDDKLPRIKQALVSDAAATVAGAALVAYRILICG